jgi:quinol monooxygenase YgiN
MLTRTRRILAGLVLVLAAGLVPAQDKGGEKKAPDLMTQLKAVKGEFVLLIEFKVQAGKEKDFLAAARPTVEATVKEKACVAYELSQDTTDPTQFVLYERWKSVEGLQLHMKEDHTRKILAAMKEYGGGASKVRLLIPAVGR